MATLWSEIPVRPPADPSRPADELEAHRVYRNALAAAVEELKAEWQKAFDLLDAEGREKGFATHIAATVSAEWRHRVQCAEALRCDIGRIEKALHRKVDPLIGEAVGILRHGIDRIGTVAVGVGVYEDDDVISARRNVIFAQDGRFYL